ncbi:hypothetical protein CCP3SC1AL1_2430006 [Gammaproteobacteria bacterium]
MSRTIKQDIELLFDIKKQVLAKMNPDFTQGSEVEECNHYVDLIFENQNKWLLSDKISSEKQQRMDQYKSEKQESSGSPDEPTVKQISYATQLGIKTEGKGYTKQELSKLIDKAVSEQKQK